MKTPYLLFYDLGFSVIYYCCIAGVSLLLKKSGVVARNKWNNGADQEKNQIPCVGSKFLLRNEKLSCSSLVQYSYTHEEILLYLHPLGRRNSITE